MSARRFGELAVARGWLDIGQLQKALDEQEHGRRRHLGEILVERGQLDEVKVATLLEEQGKRELVCPDCFVHANARDYDPQQHYGCPRCGEALVEAARLTTSGTESWHGRAQLVTVEVSAGPLADPLKGQALLTVQSGERSGLELRLGPGETIHVGSDPDQDLVLKGPGVRSLHGKVASNGIDVVLYDYGGGGTCVNGHEVDFQQLRDGDQLRFGDVEVVACRWDSGPGGPAGGLLGRVLVDRQIVASQQLRRALRHQELTRFEQGAAPRLGELLVERGLVTSEQIDEVLQVRKQKRLHVRCPGCGARFNLREEDLGSAFRCGNCGHEMQIPSNPLLMQPGKPLTRASDAGLDTARRQRQLPSPEAPPTPPAPPAGRQARLTEPIRMEGALDELDPRMLRGGGAETLADESGVGDDAELPPAQSGVLGLSLPIEEQAYGELAFKDRYVTERQLERGLALLRQAQSRGAVELSLGDVLCQQRYITPAHHQQIMNKLGLQLTPVEIPGYQLINKLGQGATGTVYHALRLLGRRSVALKIIRPELHHDDGFVRRFYREAEIAMRLSHPNIVAGVDAGQHSHYLFMVMELFEGETVEAYLTREKRMSERYALEVAYQVALALAHASSHNLIHRDVKPGNIVLDKNGHAKLIDLGLAKQVSDSGNSVTQTGLIIGTPNYISPEQARGDRLIDLRADVYALGATLYHMVTGELPHRGLSPLDTMLKHANETPIAPREHTLEVSRVVSKLIMQMLKKDPGERFQTWEEVCNKLETLLNK